MQCTAMIKVLEQLGHETIVIDYVHESARKYWAIWKSPFKAMCEQYRIAQGSRVHRYTSAVKKGINAVYDDRFYFERLKKKNSFARYSDTYWKISERYESSEELKKNPPGCDGYITGSDQVWNARATQGKLDDGYLLNFDTSEKKRLSYAASIGFDPDIAYINDILEKTKYFDGVSVREKSVWEKFDYIKPGYAELVLDPTLLHVCDAWQKIEQPGKIKNKTFALVYRLSNNPEFNKLVVYLKKHRNVAVVDVSPPELKIPGCDLYHSSCSPSQFLWYVHNCELFTTDSFHGTVFAIIYHREFYSLLRKGMESRVNDLLNECGLSGQLIRYIEQIPTKTINIDFRKCDEYLLVQRKKSIDYLRKCGL